MARTSVTPAVPTVEVGLRRAWSMAAAAAALLGMAIALLLRIYAGVPLVAESVSDGFTRFLPLPLFSILLNLFGHNAKHVLLATMLVVGSGVMAALCLGVWELRRRWLAQPATLPPRARALLRLVNDKRPWHRQAIPLAIILIVLNEVVVWPQMVLQAQGGVGWVELILAEMIPAVAVAGSFTGLLPYFRQAAALSTAQIDEPRRNSRRRLLYQGLGIIGLLAAGGIIWDVVQRGLLRPGMTLQNTDIPTRLNPPPTPVYTDFALAPNQTPELTAANNFYYVSKNLTTDPVVDIANWHLAITGKVQRPYTLTYQQLQQLPQVERPHTLECISNDIGGPYISNGQFRGVRLADVLNAAGVQPDARELIFHAADGYSDSLHLAQALDPQALIVYLLDGAPLPQPHGFPARLLIPGLYGMKNGKWLTTLEMGTGGYTGYWEERGWTREAVVKTMSRIDTPLDGDRVTLRPTVIAGIAFAADRGISRVDVTTDGGATWQTAELRRPLGALSWTLWQLPWTPTAGDHVIAVRAIDGQGYVQTTESAPTLPDGASGYHIIQVSAA